MIDVTEDDIKEWNTKMALDDAFGAASPAVHAFKRCTASRTPMVG